MPAPEKTRWRWVWRGLGFAVLLFFVFILGSINVPFLQPDEPAEVILLYVFSTLVFLAFIIYGLVLTRYLARLYAEHRAQVLGTKFKTKMVVGALAVAVVLADGDELRVEVVVEGSPARQVGFEVAL